jgi:hypothetical protein
MVMRTALRRMLMFLRRSRAERDRSAHAARDENDSVAKRGGHRFDSPAVL